MASVDQRLLPACCPSCGQALKAKRFECPGCGTAIEGDFALPPLARLSPEEQVFLIHFLQCSGSLKEMAKTYGVSYPTVRNRLDALIGKINALQPAETEAQPEEDQEPL